MPHPPEYQISVVWVYFLFRTKKTEYCKLVATAYLPGQGAQYIQAKWLKLFPPYRLEQKSVFNKFVSKKLKILSIELNRHLPISKNNTTNLPVLLVLLFISDASSMD